MYALFGCAILMHLDIAADFLPYDLAPYWRQCYSLSSGSLPNLLTGMVLTLGRATSTSQDLSATLTPSWSPKRHQKK